MLLISPAISAYAQYSFQVTIHGDGSRECKQAEAMVQQQVAKYGSLANFPNRTVCEQTRSAILAIKASGYNCKIYYTATPCTGTDMTNIGSVNPTTPPGSNPSNDLRNQIQDYDYMREIQDPESSINYILVNGDAVFANQFNKALQENYGPEDSKSLSMKIKELIADPVNGAKASADIILQRLPYVMTDLELSDFFKSEYQRLTGADIDVLLNKLNPTLEEQDLINNYNEFVDSVLDSVLSQYIASEKSRKYPEEEMAIYALGVYDDPKDIIINKPSPLREIYDIPEADRDKIMPILNILNENRDKYDFQADLYYDEKNDKYVLAFRGTDSKMEVAIDAMFAFLGISPQHDTSYSLADAITNSGLPKDKLTISGHSLGGGLAMLAGLKTGYKTYAYNPQHIPAKAVEKYNLDISPENQSNIQVYTAAHENVVNSAEGAAALVVDHPKATAAVVATTLAQPLAIVPAIVAGVPLLSYVDKDEKYLIIGDQHTVYTDDKDEYVKGFVKHSQIAMVNALQKDVKEKKKESRERIKRADEAIKRLKSEGSPVLRQKSSLFQIQQADKEKFAKPGVPIKIISRK